MPYSEEDNVWYITDDDTPSREFEKEHNQFKVTPISPVSTLAALRKSREKWIRIQMGEDIDIHGTTCGLCGLFWEKSHNCVLCPIDCHDAWYNHKSNPTMETAQAIIDMIDTAIYKLKSENEHLMRVV